MACVSPDGRPTENGLSMLKAVASEALSPEDVAEATGLPLFRVRSGLRDLEAAGLVSSGEGRYTLTDKGREIISEA